MSTRVLHQTTRRLLGALDRAVLERVLTPLPAALDPIESLSHAERMDALTAFAAFYDRPEHFVTPSPFFSRLTGMVPTERAVRRYRNDGDVIDLSWPSGFESLWSGAAADARFDRVLSHMQRAADDRAYARLADSIRTLKHCERRLGIDVRYGDARPDNQIMRARWFKHRGAPRPCAVILHGYFGGTLAVEEYMWPIRTLFDRGMDVVLTVLPMHGARAGLKGRFRLPGFPAVDPRLAIEGFRQLVHEHLTLFDYLLDGRVSALGLMGMSLGGYAAALLSTLDPRLRFSVFYMPLASIADFALRTGRMVGSREEQLEQAAALERLYRPISPLARSSLLPEGRALVITGEADLITGVSHGNQLADRFGATSSTYFGGHILQLGRDAAFDGMWRLLEQDGLLSEAF
jgi:pimeloyl-ACP methyl ester carboxylesterase